MNTAYKALYDKLGMKNARHKKLKKSEDFIGVTENGRKYYGGDQNWYYWQEDKNKGDIAVYSGCGSVAAANAFAYMAENHDKYKNIKIYKSFQKSDYLEFMKKIYEYIQPVQIFGKSFGLGSPYLMKRKLRKCAKTYNLNISINDTKRFRKFNYLVDFINSALEQDIPVMMLIGYNGKNMEVYYEDGRVTMGEFMYHWVTITELIVDYEVEEAIIRCSTWGRSAYISLKDFMKFEPLCRGLLYIS